MAAGIGLAAIGFAGRYLLKRMPNLSQKMAETVKKLDSQVEMLISLDSFYNYICMHMKVLTLFNIYSH